MLGLGDVWGGCNSLDSSVLLGEGFSFHGAGKGKNNLKQEREESRVSRREEDQSIWGLAWEPVSLLLQSMTPCTQHPAEWAEGKETTLTAPA